MLQHRRSKLHPVFVQHHISSAKQLVPVPAHQVRQPLPHQHVQQAPHLLELFLRPPQLAPQLRHLRLRAHTPAPSHRIAGVSSFPCILIFWVSAGLALLLSVFHNICGLTRMPIFSNPSGTFTRVHPSRPWLLTTAPNCAAAPPSVPRLTVSVRAAVMPQWSTSRYSTFL